MSRSGYVDDLDNWALIRYRGAVASAIRGKHGQAFLKELLSALDALPKKELTAHRLEYDSNYCALGAVGRARGYSDLADVECDEEGESMSELFDINPKLAAEIMFMNDEVLSDSSPRDRWMSMRAWIVENIKDEKWRHETT